MMKSTKEGYAKEGLEGVDITYTDNRPVLQLFLDKPVGLLSLLDEQCRANVSEQLRTHAPNTYIHAYIHTYIHGLGWDRMNRGLPF